MLSITHLNKEYTAIIVKTKKVVTKNIITRDAIKVASVERVKSRATIPVTIVANVATTASFNISQIQHLLEDILVFAKAAVNIDIATSITPEAASAAIIPKSTFGINPK